jgi:hypothetical protein
LQCLSEREDVLGIPGAAQRLLDLFGVFADLKVTHRAD